MLRLLVLFLVVTGPHAATLNYQNASCVTAIPCNLQVWRATCKSTTSCPQPNQGSWYTVSTASAVVNVTTTGTTWVVIDNSPALQDSTTYVYYATNSYVSAPSVFSVKSGTWIGTTNAGSAAVPSNPVNGTGNSIN